MTLNRKDFLALLGTAAASSYFAGCAGEPGSDTLASGASLTPDPDGLLYGSWPGYNNSIVIDALGGPIQFNIPQEGLPLSASALQQVGQSGITAVNLTVNALATETVPAYEGTVAKLSAWVAEVANHPDRLALGRTTAEIRAAKEGGQLALILGFQDAVPFEDDLDRIDEFYHAGVRIVQLTYNIANQIGVGCLDPNDTGLTELGRAAVERLDSRGILVDLSHCGPQTSLDGIRASTRPVSFTHSGCNAVYQHPRNKDDEALRLMAERGGVFGVFCMPFLNAAGPPTADHMMDHLDHAINVCGEDHVGIGTDQGVVPLVVDENFQTRFDEVSALRAAAGIAAPREDTIPIVPELNHPRRMETMAALMANRGHSPAVIDKVLGENFMRLFDEVWA